MAVFMQSTILRHYPNDLLLLYATDTGFAQGAVRALDISRNSILNGNITQIYFEIFILFSYLGFKPLYLLGIDTESIDKCLKEYVVKAQEIGQQIEIRQRMEKMKQSDFFDLPMFSGQSQEVSYFDILKSRFALYDVYYKEAFDTSGTVEQGWTIFCHKLSHLLSLSMGSDSDVVREEKLRSLGSLITVSTRMTINNLPGLIRTREYIKIIALVLALMAFLALFL